MIDVLVFISLSTGLLALIVGVASQQYNTGLSEGTTKGYAEGFMDGVAESHKGEQMKCNCTHQPVDKEV